MSKSRFTRRQFIAGTIAAGAATALPACSQSGNGTTASAAKGRVVILGFDGVEPSIAREMMDRGELPNLKQLTESGSFKELTSTIPPQSPVAWTSFTTCKNPGGHNIFDFIRRNAQAPRGPMPYVGTGKVEHPELADNGSVITPAQAETYRTGDSFWKVADEQGARCKVLNVPFAFPADTMKNGLQLCSLGVTDLRGTASTFTMLSDAFSKAELDANVAGGSRMNLPFDGQDTCTVRVPGPRDERYSFRDPKGFTTAEMKFTVDRTNKVGAVTVGDKRVEFVEGEWSPWTEVQFAMSPRFDVYSVTRFYPLQIGEQVRIYMACQQFHPDHPYVPFTEPNDYSEELYERYGLFKTIGWAYDTHALRQDALHEDAFLADIRSFMKWREKLTLDEIDAGNFDLLISAWTATDRVGHMFWRFRDPKHPMYDPDLADKFGKTLEESYRIMDGIVGNVMTKLNDDDLLMVLSDHGFESWRQGFNVNDWLQDNGYLKIANEDQAKVGFLQGLDWSNTKAYSVGLSSLYLNLEGRETQGSVSKEEWDNVISEIKDKLLEVRDPGSNMKVFTNIYTKNDFKGEAVADAPDISFGYNRYYQSSKSAAKGGFGNSMFSPNDDKWSGEHASADVAWCPGILISNKLVETDNPNILDLGVTALTYLGRDVPADFEGENLV